VKGSFDMKLIKLIASWAIFLLAFPSLAADPSEVGIVLLHGKGSNPNFHIHQKFMAAMSDRGYAVVVPKFPWGGAKGKADYSGDLTDAFNTLDSEVKKLRDSGRKTIVLVGHSMGAPAAAAYAGFHPDIAAVIGIAPGHFVGSRFHEKFTYFDVRKARDSVSKGKSEELINVEDYNSGNRRFQLNVKSKDYLSFFDPEGPFNFELLLRNLGQVPFLWVAPDADPLTKNGQAFEYFSKTPKNDKSKFIKIHAKHVNAPVESTNDIYAWLSEL